MWYIYEFLQFIHTCHVGEKYKNDDENLATAVDSVGSSLAGESYKNDSN